MSLLLLSLLPIYVEYTPLLSTSIPPPFPYGFGELLPRPSGGGIIYMKEGIQLYYNDQLGGRSPKGNDAIGD